MLDAERTGCAIVSSYVVQRQAEEQEQDSGSYITWPSGDRPATPPHLRTDPLPAVLPNEDPAQLMPEVDAEGEVNTGKQPFGS